MPGTYAKLKCPVCNRYAVMRLEEFTDLRTVGCQVDCCFGEASGRCGGKMVKFSEISRPRTAATLPDYDDAVARLSNARPAKRKAAEGLEDAKKKARMERDDDPDLVDEDEDEDDSDPDFVLSLDFNINMRFTRENMEPSRAVPTTGADADWGGPPDMTTGVVLTGSRNDAERKKPTKDNSHPKIAASMYSVQQQAPNARRRRVGSLDYYEWCHLQGVSLGGRTIGDNLVCGHYAVNTYMAVIESFLTSAGKQRPIKVTAVCEKPYVADWVRYQIYEGTLASPRPKADIWIDGRITRFSEQDQIQVQNNLRDQGLR